RADHLDPGIVDQDIGLQCERLERCSVEKVKAPHLTADLLGEPLGCRQVDIRHRHAVAGAGKGSGARCTDAAGAARDQGGAGELSAAVHGMPLELKRWVGAVLDAAALGSDDSNEYSLSKCQLQREGQVVGFMADVEVHGFVAEGYENVREAF